MTPYRLLRPLLFRLPPEGAHGLALSALRVAGRVLPSRLPSDPVALMGLRFRNRVGLAAGFDKNGVAVNGAGVLGAGFIEVGTVTPLPQAGHERPRVFRFPAARALVNRSGFPNEGADACARRLRRPRRYEGLVGVSIGKNAATPLERATDDYVACLRAVHDVADFVVINISSPNTSQLRELHAHERLEPLLTALLTERARLLSGSTRALPLALKLSPDLDAATVDDVARVMMQAPLDGVIATNTTLSRDGVPRAEGQAGGLSGAPLREIALRVVRRLRRSLGAGFPVIGCGGILCPEDALAFREAGADLVQVYTGLVYTGPRLIRDCVSRLAAPGRTSPSA
jgi:dihydroorotate dehydrogenase